MISKPVHLAEQRPTDGQNVIYYFEPFNRWYVGTYTTEDDTVSGKHGFTTWLPEVTMWMDMSLPDLTNTTS